MNRVRKLLAIAIVAFGLLSGNVQAAAQAATIPPCGNGWPTYGSNDARTRACHDQRLSGHLHIIWSESSWGILEFPPIYVNGVLYLAQDSGRLSARSVVTGKIIWQHIITGSMPLSPVYSSGVLIVPGGGRLTAYRAATGQLIWSQPWARSESSPLVVANRVFDANMHGYVIARNRDTGHWLWSRRLSAGEAPWLPLTIPDILTLQPPLTCGSGGGGSGGTSTEPFADRFTAALTYRAGIIYAVNYAGDVWALGLDGHTIWHRQYPSWLSEYSTPAVAGSALFVTSRNGYLARLNSATGALIWVRRTGSESYASPVIDRGSVYTSDYTGGFWRFNEASGQPTWHRSLNNGDVTLSSPVVLGGRVFFDDFGQHCSGLHGYTYGFQLPTMKVTFFYNDGKYQPGIDAGGRFLMTGFDRLYAFGQ